MRRKIYKTCILLIIAITPVFFASGQEYTGPIRWNPFQKKAEVRHVPAKKTTATLSLPFFEDFTDYGASPDSSKWTDFEVYINNTMGRSPVSRGVATFDDLNADGIPYDSFSNITFRYADSLTSQPIDMSSDSAADSVYLSFFYQPQGNGFFPLLQDSLMLYLKNKYGDFVKVWSVGGSGIQPFRQVMVPITDSLYFHGSFQFRFVNIAALYWADAVWNVDYIRLDKNRNIADSAVTDVAISSNPSFLLGDYSFMPYSQFIANRTAELALQVTDSIRNNTDVAQSVNYSYSVRDVGTGATLTSTGPVSVTVPAYQKSQVSSPLTITTFPPYPLYKSVVFESKYFFQTTTSLGSVINDTVVNQQLFSNYLAYDDGTAEKSYYLNLFPSLPGKIAIEYHLNHPDTLRGMAIYFGRQIPFSLTKPFAIYVYSALAGVNGAPADIAIDSTDFINPAYADSVNHFWYYTFDKPLWLPSGTFFAGTYQPLGGGSDSIYFGLDVNRVGANHAYFNVLGNWSPSLVSGAIMMRPLLGRYVSGSYVDDVTADADIWKVFPNPAHNEVQFSLREDVPVTYRLTDMQGHTLMTGTAENGSRIDISRLPAGMYFVNLVSRSIPSTPQKIIKL